MPVENIPHWTILPNWRTPILESLDSLTVVLQSPSGAEQRFAARWSPRRSFEALMTPTGRTRTLFDMAVGAVGVSSWYLPIWHDGQTTTENLGIGDTTLNCDTAFREFKAGGFVMLRADEYTSEVLEVASVSSGVLTFVAGPAVAWPAGTRLYPAIKARITDMPDMSRRGPAAIENSVRFMAEDANDFEDLAVSLGLPTYDGFLVLTAVPDESQDISHGRARLFDELDSETGLVRRYDTAGIDFTLQRHHWLNLGREEHAEMRTLFYTLDGRRVPLWLPTYAADFEMAADADSADTSIEVYKCGFTAYGGPRHGRDRIWIRLVDGTNIFREITGSSLTIDGTELVQVDTALGVSFTTRDVVKVSFMALSRLDTDTMEIEHHTDADGASRVALNFRSAPDIRSASSWTPPPLPMTTQTNTECGVSGVPHRYWEVVSIAGASSNPHWYEWSLAAVAGGPDLTSPGDGTMSGQVYGYFTAVNNPQNMIDDNTATHSTAVNEGGGAFGVLASYGAGWRQDFGEITTISEISLTTGPAPFGTQGSPFAFIIRGSDDATNWTTYVLEDSAGWLASQETRAYEIATAMPTSGRANARAWRVYVTAVDGGTRCSIAGLEFAESVGGPSISDIADGNPLTGFGTVGSAFSSGASGTFSSNNPEKVFDNNGTTFWYALMTSNVFLGMLFPTVQDIGEVRIKAITSNMNRSPFSGRVEYTTDFNTWHTAVTFTGLTAWASGEVKSIAVP